MSSASSPGNRKRGISFSLHSSHGNRKHDMSSPLHSSPSNRKCGLSCPSVSSSSPGNRKCGVSFPCSSHGNRKHDMSYPPAASSSPSSIFFHHLLDQLWYPCTPVIIPLSFSHSFPGSTDYFKMCTDIQSEAVQPQKCWCTADHGVKKVYSSEWSIKDLKLNTGKLVFSPHYSCVHTGNEYQSGFPKKKKKKSEALEQLWACKQKENLGASSKYNMQIF